MRLDQCAIRRPNPESSFRIVRANPLALQVLTCLWPDDLHDLRSYLKKLQYCGVYLLTGERDGSPIVRVGEGFKLWDRLAVHRNDVALVFVREVHLVCAPHYDKDAVVKLQELLTDAAREAGRAAVFSGTGPLRLPAVDPWRASALAREAEAAIEVLRLAGYHIFTAFKPRSASHPFGVGF